MEIFRLVKAKGIIAVFCGGFLGGIARYGIGLLLNDSSTMWGTTLVNLAGSFLLAFTLYGIDRYLDLPSWLILGIGTGFLGGFTTFSTLTLNFYLMTAMKLDYAFLRLGLNMVGGIIFAYLGYLSANMLDKRKRLW